MLHKSDRHPPTRKLSPAGAHVGVHVGAVLLSLFGVLAGCASPTPLRANRDPVVYVIERSWHSDIGLPVEEISGPLAALLRPWPGANFLTFGFGERAYVVDRHHGFFAMLSALLPSRSVLLTTALTARPEDAFGADNVVTLQVSAAGLAAIERRIAGELTWSGVGDPPVLAAGPYPGSLFYAANDTYDLLNTCNTWTADVLRSGGVDLGSEGVVFAGQVMGPVRWIAAHRR